MADADRYVPDDILHNILVQLPTQSLSRFRCVSKHWNHLISNPDFMKSISRRKIFVPDKFCMSIEKVENTDQYRMVKAHSPFKDVKRVVVGGTTNGLVLLVLNLFPNAACIVDIDMNIYNPLTRVFKKIPNPHHIHENFAFGLGHGATQDDLKIVTLGSYMYRWSLTWGVLSVKNQSWSKMSESIGYYEFLTYSGIFLNGSMYWSVRKNLHSRFILALDIKMMKLSEIQFPYDMYFTTLGTINGCLCVISCKEYWGGFELLVMKEHGIWESRLKQCSTSLLSRMNCFTFRIMCILDEGKLIIKNCKDNTFLILDLLKDSSQPILNCTGNFNQESTREAIEYVESFCNI